jgi:hypothetical protein
MSEDLDVNAECLNTLAEGELELGLLTLEVVADRDRFLDELVPNLVHVFFLVDFFFIHGVAEVDFDQVVHLVDGLELQRNVGLLLSDLLKGEHNRAERVNVLYGLVDLDADLLDLVRELLKKVLSFLMELAGESVFPAVDVLLKRELNVVSLKRKSTDLVVLSDNVHVLDMGIELLQFLLEIFKLRVVLVEVFKVFLGLAGPQPGVLAERLQELVDIVLGSLD